MPSKKKKSSAISKKIQKLSQLTQELYEGEWFNITRLTVLKSLCEKPEIAAQFVLYLAKITKQKMEGKKPKYIGPKKWSQHKKLVSKAILQMEKYLADDMNKGEESLRKVWREINELQNKHENQHWGPVRIIESSETLIVEKALECMLSPEDSSYWGYHVGREYAERYNPSYGTGLIPESAPMVEDIVNFWKQFSD